MALIDSLTKRSQRRQSKKQPTQPVTFSATKATYNIVVDGL